MNELRCPYTTGLTVTARIRNAAGQVWYVSGAAMETYGASGHTGSDYDITMTDKSGGMYVGSAPAALSAGQYIVQFWDSTVTDTPIYTQDLIWSGTASSSLADLITALAGPGEYSVTLTIRTTTGTALAGVQVWFSADGDSANAVSFPLTTGDTGQITVKLNYATYYVHCRLAGYTFLATSITPAAGSVTFVKDIASAVVLGADSAYTQSFLTRAMAIINMATDEPNTAPKYTPSEMITMLENAYCLALGEKITNQKSPIVIRFSVTVGSSTESEQIYVLPPCISAVVAVYEASDWGSRNFYDRGSLYNQLGRGVWVEGNCLHIQACQTLAGTVLTIECTPNGLARLHNGVCSVNAAGTEVTIADVPHAGERDTHVNAYAGSIIRILQATGTSPTGNVMQERIVSEYNAVTRVATLNTALDPIPAAGAGGYIYYEIAPQLPIGLDAVCAYWVAWQIGLIEGNLKAANGNQMVWQQNLRRVRLDAFYQHMQSAGEVDADTYQNRGGY